MLQSSQWKALRRGTPALPRAGRNLQVHANAMRILWISFESMSFVIVWPRHRVVRLPSWAPTKRGRPKQTQTLRLGPPFLCDIFTSPHLHNHLCPWCKPETEDRAMLNAQSGVKGRERKGGTIHASPIKSRVHLTQFQGLPGAQLAWADPRRLLAT